MTSQESENSTPPQDAGSSLERVLHSETFRKAPGLRHLLEYLVTQSMEGSPEQIKESVIAVEVFARSTDFDGRVDNIVRVQAHRLRKLLDAYYAGEGKSDRIRYSIPRGGYIAQITAADGAEPRESGVPRKHSAASPNGEEANPEVVFARTGEAPAPGTRMALAIGWSVAAAFALGIAVGALLGTVRTRPVPHAEVPGGALGELWRGIFEPGATVIFSYTNPTFLRAGQSETYSVYDGPLSAPAGTEFAIANDRSAMEGRRIPRGQHMYFSDGWTGTGEVLAANRLTELSMRFGSRMNAIPSRRLSVSGARGANIVFVGSPWMNGPLAQAGSSNSPIYNTRDGRIVVRTPVAGERDEYRNVRAETGELKTCYALFSVLPGLERGRRIVTSAGLGTLATWSAIDLATNPTGAARLQAFLKAANGGQLPSYYQVVVKTDVIGGLASEESPVAARVIAPDGSK